MVYSNLSEGELITFKYYDSEIDQMFDCNESVQFSSDMIINDAINSYELTVNNAVNTDESIYGNENGILSTYPNPFEGSLNIDYTILKSSHVRIAVFDIFGKQIEIIDENDYKPGNYSLKWEAENLPGATYIIKLVSEDSQFIQRVILIK